MGRCLQITMEKKSERIERIVNPELVELIGKLKEVDTNIAQYVEQSEKLQEQFNAELLIRQKIVDQMKPVVDTAFEGKLEEFEVLANVTSVEGDTESVDVKIVDELEVFKEKKRSAREEKLAPAETLESINEIVEETLAQE